MTTPHDIEANVLSEIERLTQHDLAEFAKRLLVPVRCEERAWDYGAEEQRYPCWIFAEHDESNTAFAYCLHGFGPSCPWGILSIHGPHLSIGMDSGWFATLEGALRDSMAWEGVNPPGYEVE